MTTSPPRTGLPAGLLAAGGGALMVIGAFLAWLTTSTETGGRTSVSGFGAISGDTPLASSNLNDLLSADHLGTFRPGLVGLVVGGIAVFAGVGAALVRPSGRRPFRVVGVLLVAAGLVGLGWGLFRGVDPGTGGVLATGEGSSGAGPWLTAAGGLLVGLSGGWLLSGRADARCDPVTRHPGIQR